MMKRHVTMESFPFRDVWVHSSSVDLPLDVLDAASMALMFSVVEPVLVLPTLEQNTSPVTSPVGATVYASVSDRMLFWLMSVNGASLGFMLRPYLHLPAEAPDDGHVFP